MSYYLFLDDVRKPSDVKWSVSHLGHSDGELPALPWTIIRDFDEFVKCIDTNGIPLVVAFDHDLAPDHYPTTANLSPDYDKHEKTGFHCAKFLVEVCIDTKQKLPDEVFVHSLNPVGRENILSIFNTAKNNFDWL
jgi:hypothetical protein